MGRTVGIVLNALDLTGNAILDTAKVHHTVVVLVPAAFVAHSNVAIVITTGVLELWLQQWRMGRALVQVIARDLHHATTAW